MLRNHGDKQSAEFVVVVDSPDSDQAVLFDWLGEDLQDFFFGCHVDVQTEEQITTSREHLSRVY